MVKNILFSLQMLILLGLTGCFVPSVRHEIEEKPITFDMDTYKNLQTQETKNSRPTWMATKGEGVYKVGKPYKVNGIWYFPKEDYKYDEVGIASWYGPGFHMKNTANGEVFDMNLVSAAHKTLPLPSVVKVKNMDNGRSITVRVNDRGPFVNDRIIDLSRKAAELLGILGQGTAKVHVQLLSEESMTAASLAQNKVYVKESGALPPVQNGSVKVTSHSVPNMSPDAKDLMPAGFSAHAGVTPASSAASMGSKDGAIDITNEVEAHDLTPAEKKAHDPHHIIPSSSGNIYVQVGAFGNKDNAKRMVQTLSHLGGAKIYPLDVDGHTVHRVRMGPYDDTADARQVHDAVMDTGHTDVKVLME